MVILDTSVVEMVRFSFNNRQIFNLLRKLANMHAYLFLHVSMEIYSEDTIILFTVK